MSKWAVLYLFSIVSASAETTLYDRLSTISVPQFQSHIPRSPERIDTAPPVYNYNPDYLPYTVTINDEVPDRFKRLIEDSTYLQFLLVSSIGGLALMPESVTSWNMEELKEKSLWVRWKDNVFKGPVWDNDDWTINYIGHPISGAFYYTMARNDGMSIGESAAFSTFMSTFFWEYGYEAFAEIPSIQDLIITPLAGSFLGEGMIILQRKLDQNGGVVWGSKRLGNIGYFLIDPLGNLADVMRNILSQFHINPDVTVSIQTYPRAAGLPRFLFVTSPEYSMLYGERQYGFVITIR